MTCVTQLTFRSSRVVPDIVGDRFRPMLSRLHLVVGLRPSILRAAGPSFASTALVARRLISTSTRSHAEHSNYSQRPKAQPSLASRLGEQAGHTQPTTTVGYDAYGNEIDPYKNGPSALDKAVHLFFFTEIIRGV